MKNYTIRNINELLLMSGDMAQFGHTKEELLGLLPDAALAIVDGKITWYGPDAELPERFKNAEIIDATGMVALPGLVDSHTHLAFAGSRELEYELRCGGVSYADIAQRGGGIKFSVEQTRGASFEDLYEQTRARLWRMLELGVTTVEIKSGYGLDRDTEMRQLEVVRKLKQEFPGTLFATYLGAHEVPKELSREKYLKLICDEVLPLVAQSGLAQFCDVFCEKSVYTVDESRRVLSRARELGLGLKIHAEELSCLGGAELAAEMRAVSADHLMHVSDCGIEKMVKQGVTFNLLPGTTLFLGKKEYAPARKIIEKGGRVALSTDCNPGSCPCENLLFITTLGCSQMRMSPAEALWAVTRGGAYALGHGEDFGQIKLHGRADVALFEAEHFQGIPYGFGRNRLAKLFVGGELVINAF